MGFNHEYCEFEKFLTEVKYIQERNYLEEKIRTTFPIFKVDKSNIISFDDSDKTENFFWLELITFKVFVPIDPVEPKIETVFFFNIFIILNKKMNKK